MGDKLRFAAALGGKEAESDHLALLIVQTGAGVVIAKAVVNQPVVNVATLLRTGLPEVFHLLAHSARLCLFACFQTILCGGLLSGKRQFHTLCYQHFIWRFVNRLLQSPQVQKESCKLSADIYRILICVTLWFFEFIPSSPDCTDEIFSSGINFQFFPHPGDCNLNRMVINPFTVSRHLLINLQIVPMNLLPGHRI